MSDDVRQIEPEDDEITEEWLRETDEPEIRAVGAHHATGGEDGDGEGWYVDIWVQEFFRQDPLGVELRQRVQAALLAVPGVTDAGEHDNETWYVEGTPSGEALTRAAARVVDDMAHRLREG